MKEWIYIVTMAIIMSFGTVCGIAICCFDIKNWLNQSAINRLHYEKCRKCVIYNLFNLLLPQ